MHVLGFNFDLNQLFQYLFTCVAILIVILQLLKTTASNYFIVDANFEEEEGGVQQEEAKLNKKMIGAVADCGDGVCVVCGGTGKKQCSGCKKVRYCSPTCQSKHWKEGHKLKCQELKLSTREKASVSDSKSCIKHPLLKKVLFPYEDFMNLFNWEGEGCPPCGLLNCGNSCYANVVLQCLSCTRPLIAYLLKIGHERKCRRNDWCFFCELEAYVKRTRQNVRPFSPINILSRLPNIGGNLGYGKQEDAHEFMRFAIDTMQSVCLDEFGGEKVLHPTSQETTLIQYIFGGHLQSQVKCSKCNKISYRHENMMDLTVEIQGDAESLEECLDQFTAEEWLDGENMYKCDGCNDYVKACKRLAVHHAPNILTIALKRFQSGRFGKLNKRVTFPETLDLGPYMSEPGNGTDIYRLYAVVVHIDMLNASYFGHYICYTKDFHGNWYRIDDCKVTNVDLDEVLAQGAYMLLYSRTSIRPSFVKLEEAPEDLKQKVDEVEPCLQATVESITVTGMPSDANSAADKEQQVVDVVEKSQPYLPLPIEPTIIEGSTNSLSTMDPSPKEDDAVCMDLDDALEVNSNYVREDGAVATDLSSVADMQEQGMDVGTIDPSSREDDSVCMNLDWSVDVNSEYPKQNLAANVDVTGILKSRLLHMDPDSLDGINLMSTREEQLDHGLDNPESSSSDMELDNCGCMYPDAIGASSSIETGTSTTVESGTSSDDRGFMNGNAITGVKESIANGLPLDDGFPSESDTCELANLSFSLPSDLHSAEKILERNSSILSGLSDPMLEQVKTVESVIVIPTAQNTTGSIPQSVDKPCSNGKQGPLLCGFVNEHTACESPNRSGDLLIQSDEVGPCKVSSNCNGFSRAGASPNVNVVLDSNETFLSNGQCTPNLLIESEKWLNKSEPGGDCSGLTSQVAEISPLVVQHSVSTSAPSTCISLPTAAYDLGISPTGSEYNVVHIGENGNGCTEAVGSLIGSVDDGLNATSFAPVVMSSSDTEMLDSGSDHVNGYQSQEGGIPVQSLSVQGTCSTKRTEAFSGKSALGPSTSFLSFSSGFLDKQKTLKFKNQSDAPEDHSDVKLLGNVNNGNKSTKHASVSQNSRQVTNHDRNHNNGDLLESICRIEDQCEKKDEDDKPLGEAAEPQQSHCNGNGDYRKADNNKTVNKKQGIPRGFLLNSPPQKTSMKKNGVNLGSSEIVSP